MRQSSLEKVYELAKKDTRVLFIGSDLGIGTLKKFKQEMPERFLMEGISEASIIGMAAGLAMEGKVPYINTIATFLTRRCFEQIIIDLCLHHVNVRLLGSGGGLVYAPLGPTHQAIDDIAILRAIPNMTIVAPADAEEMKRLMDKTLDYQGPIYRRNRVLESYPRNLLHVCTRFTISRHHRRPFCTGQRHVQECPFSSLHVPLGNFVIRCGHRHIERNHTAVHASHNHVLEFQTLNTVHRY